MPPFIIKSEGISRLLTLSGEINIEHARALQASLASTNWSEAILQIDAAAVTRLDAAALQVLAAAGRAATRTAILNASPAWTTAVQRYGFPPGLV